MGKRWFFHLWSTHGSSDLNETTFSRRFTELTGGCCTCFRWGDLFIGTLDGDPIRIWSNSSGWLYRSFFCKSHTFQLVEDYVQPKSSGIIQTSNCTPISSAFDPLKTWIFVETTHGWPSGSRYTSWAFDHLTCSGKTAPCEVEKTLSYLLQLVFCARQRTVRVCA